MNVTKYVLSLPRAPQNVSNSFMTFLQPHHLSKVLPVTVSSKLTLAKSSHCMAWRSNLFRKSFKPRPACVVHCKLMCDSQRRMHGTHDSSVSSKTNEHSLDNIQTESSGVVVSVKDVYDHILEQNGQDIVVMELSKELNYADHFVLTTAISPRHLIHLSESLNQLYKMKKKNSDPFVKIEGKQLSDSWQCIDFGNVVVHFMLRQLREKYQIEKLWLLGPDYDDLFHEREDEEDLLKQFEIEGLRLISNEEAADSFRRGDSEKVAPWETTYNEPDKYPRDFDEDEYII